MQNNTYLENEAATLKYAANLVDVVKRGMTVFLHGNLGAGKTTLVRGFLRALGHQGKVKSPTYTLVETYQLAEKTIHHFDLYRLEDPIELETMGFRDYLDEQSICFIEWPEKAAGFLPKADLEIFLSCKDGGRELQSMAN